MTNRPWSGLLVTLLGLTVGACSHPEPPAATLPEIGFVTAKTRAVPVVNRYPGRLSATLTAQVRPRVTGIVLERAYREGTDVKAGEVLFRIDPAPLEASLRVAQGKLAQAQATAHNAALKAARDQELATRGLIAKQDVADSAAMAEAGKAAVTAARAEVENAKISLGYATVTAPIAGRAGRAAVTQGALVSPSDSAPMATIEVIDPIFVNFSEPMAQVVKLQQAEKNGRLMQVGSGKAEVRILLTDGSAYAHPGTLDFTDLAVDPSTGAVNLRATVPNPDHLLLPGMFVNIRVRRGALDDVFLVPQSAIQRDSSGAFVYVVGTNDKIVERRVALGDQSGADWIVLSGLANGDRVVVSGIQQVRAGIEVKPVAMPDEAAGADAGGLVPSTN